MLYEVWQRSFSHANYHTAARNDFPLQQGPKGQ